VLREPDFLDEQWREAIDSYRIEDEGLKQWMRNQVTRGQNYYVTRLRQVLVCGGERALDAGCGMGNWSLALARMFDVVDAIDIDEVRVDALKLMVPQVSATINPRYGSIDQLPYADSSFDFLFCNGVIFLTDVQKSLREFARVTRPGGRIYVTFNSSAWWRHLLVDRAPAEPVCQIYGANGLVGAVRYRAAFLPRLATAEARSMVRECGALLGTNFRWWNLKLMTGSAMAANLCGQISATDRFARIVLPLLDILEGARDFDGDRGAENEMGAVLKIVRLLVERAPEDHQRRALAEIISRLICGEGWKAPSVHTHSFEGHQMAMELARHGFERISIAPEGGLCLDANLSRVAPIYAKRLGVLGALATRCG